MFRFTTTIIAYLLPLMIVAQTSETKNTDNYFKIGNASFYSNKFNGKQTANGEIYSSKLLTGAHKSLPMGSKVLVTNLSNGKSVIVRINDRGPYIKKRIIDLSLAGAETIGMIASGVVRVSIEVIRPRHSQSYAPIELDNLPLLPTSDPFRTIILK